MGRDDGCVGARWVTLCVGLLWLGTTPAHAEVSAQLLADLTPYDTEGNRSFDALRAIGQQAAATQDRADRAELSFLHVMGSTDLWLIAESRDEDALRARVAEQFGVEPGEVPAVLAEALATLRSSMPAQSRRALEDAEHAVRMLAGPSRGPLPRAEGTRASLAYLSIAARRAVDTELRSTQLLASMSEDPCAGVDVCEDPYARFDPQGRSALVTLQGLHASLAQLAAVDSRDPLVAAVLADVETRFAPLYSEPYRFGPRLTEGPVCPTPALCGEAAAPDVIVFVESGKVRLGRVPEVRLDPHDGVTLQAQGGPMWPQGEVIEVGGELPPYLRPLSEVTASLRELRGAQEGLRLAVGADARARAHVFARVLLSVRAAGFDAPLALARTAEGQARVQPVRVVPAPAADRLGPGELNVMMLMSGFSVRRWGPSFSIDRKPGLDGDLEFDYAALVNRAGGAKGARSSYLRFVPYVAADDLVSTAFAVAPREDQVTLILP